jgi:hypothetical protein
MKKLNQSIDILALQGAVRATIKGEDCVVIRLAKSRAKPHSNGKVYLNLEAIERSGGEDNFGNTHFVAEPSTKDERQSGVKLPIIGNGKEWSNEGRQGHQQAFTRTPRQAPKQEQDHGDGTDGDEIPF